MGIFKIICWLKDLLMDNMVFLHMLETKLIDSETSSHFNTLMLNPRAWFKWWYSEWRDCDIKLQTPKKDIYQLFPTLSSTCLQMKLSNFFWSNNETEYLLVTINGFLLI